MAGPVGSHLPPVPGWPCSGPPSLCQTSGQHKAGPCGERWASPEPCWLPLRPGDASLRCPLCSRGLRRLSEVQRRSAASICRSRSLLCTLADGTSEARLQGPAPSHWSQKHQPVPSHALKVLMVPLGTGQGGGSIARWHSRGTAKDGPKSVDYGAEQDNPENRSKLPCGQLDSSVEGWRSSQTEIFPPSL